MAWLNELIDSTNRFMPHGSCYLWLPSLVWLHIISDAVIALAYFSIPFALLYFVHKRTDLAYRWVFVLFGIFILLCGTTHLMAIWTIWHPDYWLDGMIKFATALISLLTACLIWQLIPNLLLIPSPQQLKTNETYLRAIFNATPDAILISNEQGIITMANHQAEVLLAYPEGALIGLSIEMIVPERFRANHSAFRAQFLTAPSSRSMAQGRVVKALKHDLSELDVDIRLSPIQTEQGLFIASALRDVTLQKQAEEALQASEERFRKVANNAPMLIWITDANGNSTFVNQAWLDLTGLEATQSLFNEWLKMVHPDDRDSAFNEFYRNTQCKDPIMTEYRVLGADGTWHWILDKALPTFNLDGHFSGYIGSALDITERKRTEIQLRIAATAFETQEAMVIADADRIVMKANKAFTLSTGYTADETIGQHLDLLKSEQHSAQFYSAIWENVGKEGTWQGEIWGRRKNGENFPNWLVITSAKTPKGVVSHYICTYIDITERKLAEEKIKKLAYFDPLTQLPNRSLLMERLNYGLELARREGRQLAIMMLDLDRFKPVNDNYGHHVGDNLLQKVGDRLKARLRSTDTIARWGGDEFVVLLENLTHPDDAARIAQELLDEITKPFQLLQSEQVQIGVSIGISLYPQHADNAQQLLDYSDAALYLAKDQGRACIAYYSEEISLAIRERMNLEVKLNTAIDQQQLCVFYQPQVDIESGCIIGAEALIRWRDPEKGLISPALFIPIAEESSLILKIGEWVLLETCRQGRIWLDMGYPPITLTVNVSSQQFRRSDINALIISVLEQTGFPASQLGLEITESGIMDNKMNASGILENLHSQGIKLAIDDFGTGYSSLAYLKHFPVATLKIDKSFIDDIPNKKDDMEIASTIVGMGHTLGIKVMAEGVETQEQLEFLKSVSCDAYQGYLKSRPLPAKEFAELFLKPPPEKQLSADGSKNKR